MLICQLNFAKISTYRLTTDDENVGPKRTTKLNMKFVKPEPRDATTPRDSIRNCLPEMPMKKIMTQKARLACWISGTE